MLRSFRIQRFKSIHDQTLDLGAVNLIIGPNGTGKSNVLEALGVLSSALVQGIDPNSLSQKGVRLSLPRLFKSAFKNHDLPKTFRLEAVFDNGRYECSVRAGKSSTALEFHSEALYEGERQVFGRSMHGIKLHSVANQIPNFDKDAIEPSRSVWSVISPIVEVGEGLREELDDVASFAIYAPQTAVMRGQAIDTRVVEPLGLAGSGLPAAFRHLQDTISKDKLHKLMSIVWASNWLNQIVTGAFDSNIVPPHVSSPGGLSLYLRDKYMHADRNFLSPFDASEGTLYLMFVATLMCHDDTPKVFALDNVDGTLNPRLVRLLTEYIVESTCGDSFEGAKQVFLTSHHPSSLDSFDIFDDGHRIFICSRQADVGSVLGASRLIRLKPPTGMDREKWNLTHNSVNLSELFLENRIPEAL